MSSSGSTGIGHPTLEDFPNELLLPIFRSATETQDPLDRCHLDLHGNRRLDPFARRRYDESLVTKLSLVMVCRRWNALATPMLYEHIDVSGERQRSEALMRTIASHRPPKSNPQQRSLQLVRRLEVSIPFGASPVAHQPFNPRLHQGEFQLQELDLTGIASALRDLIHLEVFAITIMHVRLPQGGLGNLLKALSPTLKTLLWYSPFLVAATVDPPFQRAWIEFFNIHPCLTSIDIPYDLNCATLSLRSPGIRVTQPTIRHWSLPGDLTTTSLPAESVPNLETISLSFLQTSGGTPTTHLCQFISAQGRRLTSIRLTMTDGLGPTDALIKILKSLKEACPLLHQVQFCLPYFALRYGDPRQINEIAASVEVPSVRMLGLEFSRLSATVTQNLSTIEWHYALLLPWRRVFPYVRTLRLLLEADVEELKGHDRYFKKTVEWCNDVPFVLEDNFGNALTEEGQPV